MILIFTFLSSSSKQLNFIKIKKPKKRMICYIMFSRQARTVRQAWYLVAICLIFTIIGQSLWDPSKCRLNALQTVSLISGIDPWTCRSVKLSFLCMLVRFYWVNEICFQEQNKSMSHLVTAARYACPQTTNTKSHCSWTSLSLQRHGNNVSMFVFENSSASWIWPTGEIKGFQGKVLVGPT